MSKLDERMEQAREKNGVKKVGGFYFSVLEHEWTIIVEAENAHGIENLCIESGISAFNTVRIVPLMDFKVPSDKIKGSQH